MWHTKKRKMECISFVMQLIAERFKNATLEVKMFSFLCWDSEGYTFLKLLSNSRWPFMAHKLLIKKLCY